MTDKLIFMIVICISVILFALPVEQHHPYKPPTVHTVIRSPVIHVVTGTYYNAEVGQTDSRPLETADGSQIDRSKLRSGALRWVALSRDLIDRHGGHFSYGDSIYVYHPDVRLRGWWILRDTMNKRFKNRIDFLIHKGTAFPGLSEGILISKTKFI